MKRQNEYEQWKSNYIQERAKLDAAAVASTATILYFLGGIIYKGMGNVNPSLVFHANQKGAKAKPKYYLNSQFGYSYSSVPFLYLSQISTMVNGKTITSSSFKGYDGFFLNLGGQFNIGFHSNYYSFYGNFGLLGGIEPTFKGSNFIFNYGGGGSIGSKPVKIYGRYRLNDMVDYSMKTGNVEEQNEINSKLSSKEYELGLQFTFGGGVKSNFKRTHLFLGLLQKEFDLPWGSSEAYFNFNKSVIQNFGKVQVKGYSFEIRKDHTFSFFTRYYPEHVYFGQVGNYNSANGTLPAKLEHPNNSFIELGIYRCLDAF